MLDPRKNSITDMSAVLAQIEGDPASLQNQIQILTSRDLAAKVVASLKLEEDPEFNPALARPGIGQVIDDLGLALNPSNWFAGDSAVSGTQRLHERILDNFAKACQRRRQWAFHRHHGDGDVARSGQAARIANALVDAYIDDQIATKRNAASAAAIWLNQHIRDLAQQLQQQESAIAAYKAVHDLNDSAPGSSLVDQQMAGINAQIVQARSELAEKQAQNDRVQALIRSGNGARCRPGHGLASDRAASHPAGRADPPGRRPLHQIRPASSQDEGAGRRESRPRPEDRNQEVSRLAGAIASDVTVARAHLDSLEASLNGTVRQQTAQNMARVHLDALQSNAASTRAQYEAFVGRLRQTQDQDTAVAPDSRVISAASVPTCAFLARDAL